MGRQLATQATNPARPELAVSEGPAQETALPSLVDAEGPSPTFPPRQFSADGHLIPLSDEERRARARAAARALAALDRLPDDDPPGSDEAMMRGIDAHRAPGCKLFEGLY